VRSWIRQVVRRRLPRAGSPAPPEPSPPSTGSIRSNDMALFRRALASAPVAMALFDLGSRRVDANAAFLDYAGVVNPPLSEADLARFLHPAGAADAGSIDAFLTGAAPSYEHELRVEGAGRSRWLLISVGLLGADTGAPLGMVLQAHDMTSRRQRERRLRHLAEHDDLTGLLNRRRFDQELVRQVAYHARYDGSSGALLLLDFDGFKAVNDAYGHATGDRLLRSVADAIARRVRSTDVLGRIGGDEFAVILPQASADEALVMTAELLETVRNCRVRAGSAMISVTLSVGIVLADDDDVEQLREVADAALYAAKAAGGDGFVFANARVSA
jgi:diguanylate cyclase (GGDEF)-like protein/PAS domain S-box-containing protein